LQKEKGGREKPIKFLCKDPYSHIPTGASDGYNVILNPRLNSNEALEITIGHELGHVKCKHVQETACLRDIYNTQRIHRRTNVDNATFERTILDFIIATEAQADIVGIFNKQAWLRNQKNHYQNYVNSLRARGKNPNSYEFDLVHPTPAVMADYYNQMHTAAQRGPRNINPGSIPATKSAKQNTDNTQQENQAAKFMRNFINNMTAKKALTACGVIVAAYIILK
jgi:hypothetical protein